MTDSGRKDLSDKLQDKFTPQGSKSTTDKIGEGVSGTYDKAARDIVPDGEKSHTQSASDKMSREKDHQKHGDSLLDKTKGALGMDKH